ncbi:excinuclease ABC subunit C [Bathymodiolus japonicus methanotrophic gill symbiont]|uniref:excinuclease ABC subunit UvrC n=1 Tax=Bathymodiolus japonicus methanotrophic gill symbiont TaxID=113269 RepID=UPI001B62E967|nr:excinuclease ABC subunit UvrC [Bathymodiolus japonicus methanotrophic gill symbiont]GFO72361.1 excinuclease ABC subunit C [Bathymodiolus japonicus methanotrophic gill symbiont]
MTTVDAASADQQAFDIEAFLKNLTRLPGIYKMLNDKDIIVYIGKAKNLKNRVSSYFRKGAASPKQQVMVAKIARIEVTVTHTEADALLLESQLIKKHKPRYNICLRDDKFYPFIYISAEQQFPQITSHRGAKKKQGNYYGPYPSAGAVRETLKQLQKIFPIRQCEDSYYKNRSRPCLQHQIERCTAPCVGLISQEKYAEDVNNTQLFLAGKGSLLIDKLVQNMDNLAADLAFEQAAIIRDQISQLRTILEKNYVHGERGDVDIVACATRAGVACVQIFFIRNGQNLGNKTFFPKISDEYTPESILQAFIPQYYLDKNVPYELIVSHQPAEVGLLTEVLASHAGHNVAISPNVRSDRAKWLQMACTNVENALLTKLSDKQGIYARFLSLQEELGCQEVPRRLECFDISHTQGEYTVASCVVFDREGPVKSAYRRFNIAGITRGDDYAAIYQAVARRFRRLVKGEHEAPDILFIDGGKGQVNEAEKALAELQVNNVMIVGVSKGPDRKAGMEKMILPGQQQPIDVTPGASGLLLIQHIRDEAHRFAITGHRTRRGKAKKQSTLETIAGLGPKRRQILLRQFGGMQGISRSGVDALCSVDGISRQLAQRIYDTFHHQDD